MFCTKCGRKLEDDWKVCPGCGQKIDTYEGADTTNEDVIQDVGNQSDSNETIKAEKMDKLNTVRFWGVAICGFIIGIVTLVAGSPLTGILIMLAGLLFCPAIMNRFSWKGRVLIIIAAVALCFVGARFYNGDAEGMPDYVGIWSKKQAVSLPDNDLEHLISCSADEIIEYGFIQSDTTEDMFKTEDNGVSVIYDGTKLYAMTIDTEEYNFHGIKLGMTMGEAVNLAKDEYSVEYQNESQLILLNKDRDIMMTAETALEEEGTISRIGIYLDEKMIEEQLEIIKKQQSDDELQSRAIRDEDRIWFTYYNQFQKLDGSERLGVVALTDALLSVRWMSGTDSVEWQLAPEPAAIGSDGQMIYYYGKDIVLSYYPDDHHISIQSSETGFAGEYAYFFDFNGGWSDSTSGRCYMEIISQNDKYYEILIDWANSASENTHWEFMAEYDANRGCLVYQNGQRTEQYFPDGGGTVQETVVYTDGSGTIYPEDGRLYWNDYKENAGSNCVFEK